MHGLNKGSRNGAAKLTEMDVRQIKRLCDMGVARRSIARSYLVHPDTIKSIKLGLTWGWLGDE